MLAACPGAGKTEIAIEAAARLIDAGAAKRILVLAHGTVVLRNNFASRLAERRPELLASIDVRIPQQWQSIAGKYCLVIVDEAHQFYEAEGGLVSRVIRRAGSRRVLLLSGTPFLFRARRPPIEHWHSISIEELRAEAPERLADPTIEISTSAYAFSDADRTAEGDVGTHVRYTQAQTDATMTALLGTLLTRLRRAGGAWPEAAKGMGKTIIACRGTAMADQVGRHLSGAGVAALVSHSKVDANSARIAAFKEGEARVLAVADRAQLGFDMPELRVFVDLTGSKNPSRLLQMLCRVIRPHPGGGDKLFVKCMPPSYSLEELMAFMTGVASLGRKENFETWDGAARTFHRVRVPVTRVRRRASGRDMAAPLHPGMLVFGSAFRLAYDDGSPMGRAALGEIIGHAARRDFGTIIEDNGRFKVRWKEGDMHRGKRGFRTRAAAESFLDDVKNGRAALVAQVSALASQVSGLMDRVSVLERAVGRPPAAPVEIAAASPIPPETPPAGAAHGTASRFIDAQEAGALMGVSARMIHKLAARGDLPRIQIGRAVRYSRDDIAAYLSRSRT